METVELGEISVSRDFIEENKIQNLRFAPRKGGPYTKDEKDKRMNEVYKLHFDYGYSARKISELMKINRNTINADINYWYSKISKNTNLFNPEKTIVVNIQRLELQRSRLREQLDKTKPFQEKITLERMIYEIDCKILYTYSRIAESSRRILDLATQRMNKWMKEEKSQKRYMTLFDQISISDKAREKIEKIIKEDKEKPRSF